MSDVKGRPACGPAEITQFPAKVTRWLLRSILAVLSDIRAELGRPQA